MPQNDWKVILMAGGASSRFFNAGYAKFKAQLPVRDRRAIYTDHESTPLNSAWDFAMEIGRSRHNIIRLMHTVLYDSFPGHIETDVRITRMQNGAAMTALLAGAHLEPDDKVVFVDTDNIYYNGEYLRQALESKASVILDQVVIGSVLVGIPTDHRGKFQEMDDEYPIICGYSTWDATFDKSRRKVSVDQVHNPHSYSVNCGIYFCSRWELFTSAVAEFMSEGTSGSEVSLVDVIRMVRHSTGDDSVTVTPIWMDYKDWTPLGTPVQYERNKGF